MRKYSIVPLFVALVGCSHTRPSIQTTVRLDEAVKKEATDISERKVVSQDNILSFSVKGRSIPVVQHLAGGVSYYYSTIDVGANSPIECFFYKTEISPASSIKTMSNAILSNEKIVGKIAQKAVSMFGAGTIESSPFLLLNTSFRTDENKVGNLKAMVALKDASSVICLHNDVGYNQTFSQRFVEIVSSLKVGSVDELKPQYRDVLLLKLGEMPIGFVASYLVPGQNKTSVWIEKTSLLFPESESAVKAIDDTDLEVSDHEGSLILGRYKSEMDSKISHLIEIGTNDLKAYAVKGMVNDQNISTTINTYGIVSNYGHTKMLPRKLFEQDLRHFSIPVYSPSRNPAGTVNLRTSLKSMNQGSAVLRVDAGEEVITVEVEMDGTSKEMTIPAGPYEVKGTRVFKSGSLIRD